ncbi:glycosyltransferase family 2 protein [Pedobacter sp. L105]|uniref:glycosyltransferase family 2 protein n=1 Tax=Pedobacter sp. L105 TaxID=1641871 RepID=UPI00131C66BE|nr:glycosyltransferase family 2 protein [Pedobacter sp. L105]
MTNAVSSITVTYNPDLDLLSRQIGSLAHQVSHLIIIDNASANIDAIELLVINFVNQGFSIQLKKLDENKGLGFGQNRGIELAKESNSSHIIILDQDSIPSPEFITKMLLSEKVLLSKELPVGAIGPVYFNEVSGEIYPITKYYGPFIERIKPKHEPVEATFLIASGCFIRMSVLEDVGLMNEDLFIDYVDVEWCFRAKSKGYLVYADPEIVMSHTIGDNRVSILGRTISVHSPIRRYYLYRNSIFMVKNKSIDFGYKLREVTFNILRLSIFLILSKEKKKYFKYSMKGFSDGFKGVVGKCPYTF